MKKVALMLSFLLSSLGIANAQTYSQFPDSNGVWSVYDQKYFVMGDTLYNNINYKKYYVESDSVFNAGNGILFSLLREDIASKKIYAVNLSTGTENLLYDFSLNVNDTVSVFPLSFQAFSGPACIKVDSIDSIWAGSQYRKRFNVSSNNFGFSMNECWIEGIGSTFGVFNSGLSDVMVVDLFYPILLCYEQDTALIYHNLLFSTCYSPSPNGINENNKDLNMSIYPNPFQSVLFYEVKQPHYNSLKLSLFDLAGKNVFKSETISGNSNRKSEIDLSYLTDGIYILQTEIDSIKQFYKIVKM